jgi:hypothetical protein
MAKIVPNCSTFKKREISRNGNKDGLPLFEIALVLMRVDYVASSIVNADYSIM